MTQPRQKRPLAMHTAAAKYRSQKALTFDGIIEWMGCIHPLTDTFPQTGNDPFSISIWVKNTNVGVGVTQTIIGRWTPDPAIVINDSGWRLYIEDWAGVGPVPRALWFFIGASSVDSLWVYSDASFPLNQWVHVAITYDGSRTIAGLKMYWNNVLQSTTTLWGVFTGNAGTSNEYSHLLWGAQEAWGGAETKFFEGTMDETAVFENDVGPTGVRQLWHQGKPQHPMHVAPCSEHWRMGDWTDGSPFLGILWLCFGRYPVGSVLRNAFWNNAGAARITEDVPA